MSEIKDQLLQVKQTASLKLQPNDAEMLNTDQQTELSIGDYDIKGYAFVDGHLRVSLTKSIPGFGDVGYLSPSDVQLSVNGETISYDANSVALTIIKTTDLKVSAEDSTSLAENQKVTLPSGMIYGVSNYAIESGNLKVTLTENIPNFGNTGYIHPDFIFLSRYGQFLNPSPELTYEGPLEILVNTATILSGNYPKKTTKVSLIAEDKHPLDVTLDAKNTTWQVELKEGFKRPGYRWLRLKATDKDDKILGSLIINISVSSDPMTVGDNLVLTILENSFFKVSPFDSSKLGKKQKIELKAGQTFAVSKYGLVDGHLKLLLKESIAPLGNFGYLYEPHVKLAKGEKKLIFNLDEVPNTDISAQMLVTTTTILKTQPKDSSNLPEGEMTQLSLGATYSIKGYAATRGYFRITLVESIPGFGDVGYVYWQHVKIKKEGREVSYDPHAITATVLQNTVIKKRPIDAKDLDENEKKSLYLGRVYGVDSYSIENGHVKASLTEEIAGFGNTGYIFPRHILLQRGGKTVNPLPNQLELNIGYLSQRDNPRYYWSTCNVTSIAMVFTYYGVRAKSGGRLADELLQWCFNYGGVGSQTDHSVLVELIQSYGFKASFDTQRTWSEVKEELQNRRPVVLAGDFTASGHIICLIGYTRDGYIVNDPWGDALTGYEDTEGAQLLYPYDYMDEVAGPDGYVWAHFISR